MTRTVTRLEFLEITAAVFALRDLSSSMPRKFNPSQMRARFQASIKRFHTSADFQFDEMLTAVVHQGDRFHDKFISVEKELIRGG
jgi:hypothetical protein